MCKPGELRYLLEKKIPEDDEAWVKHMIGLYNQKHPPAAASVAVTATAAVSIGQESDLSRQVEAMAGGDRARGQQIVKIMLTSNPAAAIKNFLADPAKLKDAFDEIDRGLKQKVR